MVISSGAFITFQHARVGMHYMQVTWERRAAVYCSLVVALSLLLPPPPSPRPTTTTTTTTSSSHHKHLLHSSFSPSSSPSSFILPPHLPPPLSCSTIAGRACTNGFSASQSAQSARLAPPATLSSHSTQPATKQIQGLCAHQQGNKRMSASE